MRRGSAFRRAVGLISTMLAMAGLSAVAPAEAVGQLVTSPASRVAIAEAVPDVAAGTITIAGSGFGGRPFVTLDLIPLDVQVSNDSRIIAVVPLAAMPPGDYQLTVSRGAAPGESASIDVSVHGGKRTPDAPAVDVPLLGGGDPAATIDGQPITVAEVDREWQRTDPAGYLALMRQLDASRRRIVNQLVADQLLAREAKTRGITTEALLAEELPKRTIPLPDAAVSSLYASLNERTRGASLDQLRPALRAWLAKHTEPELARATYVEELMKTSARADVVLPSLRTNVAVSAEDPVLGPATAPITIVVFGDLQSNEYVRLAQEFGRARDTFGARVRLVYKPLPTFGAPSAAVAQAAACAHAQGKFWAYHDAAMKPGSLEGARLTTLARDVGLDVNAFTQCRQRPEVQNLPQRAVDDAARYGVAASPTLLVNGRLAPDAPPFLPPFEYLKRLVEEELQRQAREAAGR